MPANETTLDFRSWNVARMFPGGQAAATLLAATFTAENAGKRDFKVRGVATGLNSLQITLRLADQSTTVTAVPGSDTGLFEADLGKLTVPAEPRTLAYLEANDAQTIFDRVVFAVIDDTHTLLPKGSLSLLEPERFRYLAGTPDRIIERRTFGALANGIQSLSLLAAWLDRHSQDISGYYMAAASGGPRQLELDRVAKGMVDAVQASKELADPQLQYVDMVELRGRIIAEAVRASIRPASNDGSSQRHRRKKQIDPLVGIPYTPGSTAQVSYTTQALQSLVHSSLLQWAMELDLESPVGVMYYERMRFQPAGLVIGEPFYTLSLAPGEEVQLRQVVETRKNVVLEDVKDREDETNLSLTSAWTTDVSQALGSSDTLQSTFTTNAGGNLTVPSTPIGGNAGIGSTVSDTSQNTAETSFLTNMEQSFTATQRMRAQHKIRMEITDERASSLSTARTLRNRNQQRSQTYIFSKVYRKERATFERYNARLCLRLVVDNPAAQIRATFLAGLDKIDPDNTGLYIAEPDAPATFWEKEFKLPPQGVGELTFPGRYGRNVGLGHLTILIPEDTRREDGAPAGVGPILANEVKLVMDEYTFHVVRPDGSESTKIYRSETQFRALGGDFGWVGDDYPKINKSQTQGTIAVRLRHEWHVDWEFRTTIYEISSVKLRLKAHWSTNTTTWGNYQSEIRTQRRALVQALQQDPGKIYRLRDISQQDFRGKVIELAARRYFNLDDAHDINRIRHIFALDEAIVETAPYWTTEAGVDAYNELQWRLERLPVAFSMDEILVPSLTSARAVVYIPVYEGRESDALKLINYSSSVTPSVAGDLAQLRADRYSAIQSTLPTYDVVAGPIPPMGTPTGSPTWTQDWEKPQRKFEVLGQWQEIIPTDGVHVETRLSDTVVTDEHATEVLARGGSGF